MKKGRADNGLAPLGEADRSEVPLHASEIRVSGAGAPARAWPKPTPRLAMALKDESVPGAGQTAARSIAGLAAELGADGAGSRKRAKGRSPAPRGAELAVQRVGEIDLGELRPGPSGGQHAAGGDLVAGQQPLGGVADFDLQQADVRRAGKLVTGQGLPGGPARSASRQGSLASNSRMPGALLEGFSAAVLQLAQRSGRPPRQGTG